MKYTDRDKLLNDDKIDREFRRKVVAVLADLRGQGLPACVVEVLRSKLRAEMLKFRGASKNGSKSKHCIGKAADIAFVIDGKLTWNVPQEYWDMLMSAAEAHDLVAGGRWAMRDYNHIEMR